jgi:1-aminocyclopropane-1-carboxylate deaminase
VSTNFLLPAPLVNPEPVQLTAIQHPLLIQKQIKLYVLREDQRIEKASGNKWHKLKYNLIELLQSDHPKRILSFGGVWSNHIHALAATTAELGIQSIGIIRGEESLMTEMLKDAKNWGMELHFVSRQQYRLRHDPKWQQQLAKQHQALILPEGGSNQLAVKGCADITTKLQSRLEFDYICSPVGSGGTIAGISLTLRPQQKPIGYTIVKDSSLPLRISQLLNNIQPTQLELIDASLGGYAKINTDLINFIQQWESFTNIPIEPIYSGKMFYQLWQNIENNHFPTRSTIVAVHTGGMQGLRGMQNKIEHLKTI